MPEIPGYRRGAGPQVPRGPRDTDGRPPIRVPDQSRYGPTPGALAGPGRVPRWLLLAWSLDGPITHNAIVIGEAAMFAELAELEASPDFAGAIAMPR